MDLFLFNLGWMIFNVFLAFIPVFLVRQLEIFNKKKLTFFKLIGAIVWFFFLPNTLYLVTDIVNFFYDVNYLTGTLLVVDFLMYIVLIPIGIATYIWSVTPFEKMFLGKVPLFVLNLFVAFGVVLGRVQRANSWEVVSDPQSIVLKSLEIIRSLDLILLVLVFALFSQVVYVRFKAFILFRP